jgi:hypothetical protein
MVRKGRTWVIAVAGAAALAGWAAADSWLAPYEQDYYSANKAYYLHVVPGDGATPARGTLFEAASREGDDRRVWSRELLNPSAPHQVLVADSGEYVVTFDEWGRVGYGPNVVVIYGPEGDVVKNFALEDLLTEEEITRVPHTVSSRWWGGDHYLDEEAGKVVLVVGREAEPTAVTAPEREIRITLATGEVAD